MLLKVFAVYLNLLYLLNLFIFSYTPTIHTIVPRGTSSVLQGRKGGSAYRLYNGTVEVDSLECPVHCLSPPLHFGHIFTVYRRSHIFIKFIYFIFSHILTIHIHYKFIY